MKRSAIAFPGGAAAADTSGPRIVQPGAPGQPARVLEAGERIAGDEPSHTEADLAFMQGMILHHAQALEMTALVPERTQQEDIRRLALRIERSQYDEIALMARWLEVRDAPLPSLPAGVRQMLDFSYDPESEEDHGSHGAHHDHHAGHPEEGTDHAGMHGMLSNEQMQQLAEAAGEAFDQFFLKFMIYHHEGAITMVEELFAAPGGGQEGDINTFASHVASDQRIEIERMQRMLDDL